MKKITLFLVIVSILLLFMACSKNEKTAKEINIGYFPNISHAPAMIGIEKGIFQKELGDLKINTQNFSDGSLFMDALSTDQVDIGYVGPGPVLNRYLQGGEVVLLSNASKGENVLVVRKYLDFKSLKDLEGKIVATPSTGCTHDLILRKMLQEEGLAVEENGGKVKRIVQKPSAMMGLFKQNQIDAALVSEPWASLLEAQGLVNVVKDVDELPWEGDLPATVLVARKDFAEKNPEIVGKFLTANKRSIDLINNNKEESVDIIAKQIKSITGQDMEKNIIENSLKRVEFTDKTDKNVLQEFADLSKELGLIKGSSDLKDLIQEGVKK